MKHPITKKDIILIVLGCLAFVCNFLIFNQLDVIMHNQNDFGITAGEVLWFFILIGLLFMAALVGLLLLLCRFCQTAYKILLGLLLGYTLASYAQVLFFNGDSINAMDGSALYTGINGFGVFMNLVGFFVIFLAPVVLLMLVKKRKELLQKLVLIVCVVVVGMQSVGLITTAANIQPLDADAKYYYFSVDDYLQVSQNENIIVFMMDRLTTQYVEDVFDRWGDTATQIFDGFTWYQDNISEYRQTFPSVAATITGGANFTTSQSQIDFLPTAWENNTVFKALKKHGYRVNGLLDANSTYYNIAEVEPYFDNIKVATKAETKVNYDQVLGNTTGIAAIRNLPFLAKNWIPVHDYANLANVFVDLSNCDGYYPKATSPSTDLYFYDTLQKTPLTVNDQPNTFNFVHLNSAHNPYLYDENLDHKIFQTTDAITQAYGCMKILQTYFNQLKNLHDQNGVSLFDKATIIVMADHGHDNEKFKDFANRGVAYASLFIKRAGETDQVPLYTNNTAQMSNRNFAATILELLGEAHDDASYFDLDPAPKAQGDEMAQERYFYYTLWSGYNGDFHSVANVEWTAKINGSAYDEKNWDITYC
ncbi:MAG: LTA synthase family protein [Prevotella sp.]|nr:LTA synthase family protein [Prevotella sp.]